MQKKKKFSLRLPQNHFLKKMYKNIKESWKDENSRFRRSTAIKMTFIPFLSFTFLAGLIAILLKMNVYFFEANQNTSLVSFEEVFFDFLFSKLSSYLPYGIALLIIVNMLALWTSGLLLRPFKAIANYCEGKVEGSAEVYNQDFFTDLKLLTQFSDFFFNHIEKQVRNETLPLRPISIPQKYTRIHKPVFETQFFLHFFLYIFISVGLVSAAIYIFAVDLYGEIIILAKDTISLNDATKYFLTRQEEVLHGIIAGVSALHIFMYLLLTGHLYYKVSAPAFGIFATMRSFLKGNYNARVHLIGFSYLRGDCRKLNKYLDYIQKNLVK
jgi:hypothetical protein